MTPERKKQIREYTVHEYYWAGEFPVYVNNRLTEGSFEEVVKRLESEG